MMIKYFLFCLTLIVSTAVEAHPTTQQLKINLAREGTEKVISDLYGNEAKEWIYVTDQIAKGNDKWLQIALLLAPGVDAESAETLSTSVGLAIPHNPSGVLDILTSQYPSLSVEQVCGLPFYSMSEVQLNQYVVDAIRALYKVSSSKECLDAIVNTLGQSNGFIEDN